MAENRFTFRAAVNAAVRLVKAIDDQYDDEMSEFAPSEHPAVIGDIVRRRVEALQRRTGWSLAELLNECEGRTSPGWVWNSGIAALMNG